MELRHLRYFVAVAEELHFRRAAERLHVAQPAVSEQIRKLEQELGVQLFDRTPRKVRLTPAGVAMLEEARYVLRHADIARRAARSAHDHAVMLLRVGYLPDSLPAAVPRALRHITRAASQITVQLDTGSTLRLIDDVRTHRLDTAVVSLPAPTAGLRTTLLGRQRLVAVVPASHRQAQAPEIALERLAPERLVLLPRDMNPALHNAVAAICHEAGISPTLVEVEAPRVEDVLLAVSAGAGIALVPESVPERYASPGIRFVPLRTATPLFQSAAVSRPDANRMATSAFLRALTHAVRIDEARSHPGEDGRPAIALVA
jgi:DNA-binding transcriptional LysR family regulator